MTVATTPLQISYDCIGTTGPYVFTFGVGEISDIEVVLTNPTGAITVLTVTTDYSVVGVPIEWDAFGVPTKYDCSTGGTVTTVVAYGVGNIIRIETDIPITQESVFTQNMPTLYKTFENALDKLTRIEKQFEIRLITLELRISTGLIPPSNIAYLGRLANDPNTSGWGVAQAFTVWSILVEDGTYRGRYWNGAEILTF